MPESKEKPNMVAASLGLLHSISVFMSKIEWTTKLVCFSTLVFLFMNEIEKHRDVKSLLFENTCQSTGLNLVVVVFLAKLKHGCKKSVRQNEVHHVIFCHHLEFLQIWDISIPILTVNTKQDLVT